MSDLPSNPSLADELERIHESCRSIKAALQKVIVGQDSVIDEVIISVVAGGHSLLEGVPGLAKTLLISLTARCLGFKHARIQFTPDLMPSDILGSEVLEEDRQSGQRHFRFIHGPIFTQMLLADEINRTPPKTQAALLQAMQERTVSIGGRTERLPEPFLVFATQNPIENEGTYPLPEAQLDRFMLKINMKYPQKEAEMAIALMLPDREEDKVEALAQPVESHRWRQVLEGMPMANALVEQAVRLVRSSRPTELESNAFIKDHVRWGAGPRAAQHLLHACRALAASQGRATPDLDDLQRVFRPVMRHRIIPSFSAEANRVGVEDILSNLLA